MSRERIISEVETVEDAKKLEETVKTGYAEASIETLSNWIAVEDDLAASYERMAAKQGDPSKKGVFDQLARESKANVRALSELRRSFEDLDRARVERIKTLGGVGP